MGNPVRPWINFLFAWERLDHDARLKRSLDGRKLLRQLRAQRKELGERIKYWENEVQMMTKAARSAELIARGRERESRVVRVRKRHADSE
jgi:hypothetical protein